MLRTSVRRSARIEGAFSSLKFTVPSIQTMLSGEIINGVSFQINDDYFLGDIIQFENNYGISAATRIIEVIYNEDETGVNIIPTFAEMEV